MVSRLCPNCGENLKDVSSLNAGTFDIPVSDSELLESLLNSNSSPRPHEETVVRKIILDARNRLAQLELEIRRLESTLQVLYRQRQTLQQYSAAHERILSPMRRIPGEIIEEIVSSYDDSVSLDTTRGPWAISQISSRWRSAALNTPSLWSNISLTTNANGVVPSTSLAILKTILKRAATHALSVNISLFPDHSLFSSCAALIQMIVTRSQQWKTLSFIVHPLTNDIARPLLDIKNRLPLLENLFFSFAGGPVPSGIFGIAPKLRSVEFAGLIDLQNLSLPWDQISKFRSSSYCRADELFLLKRMSNLVDYWGNISHVSHSNNASAVVQLDTLRRLSHNGHTLQYIAAPRLEELEVRCENIAQISTFISNSGCHLTSLAIKGYHETHNVFTIAPILSSTPDLTKFSFECASEFEEIVSLLTIHTNPASCLLPKLRDLRLSFAFREDQSPEEEANPALRSTMSMIQSRWHLLPTHEPIISPFRSVKVDCNSNALKQFNDIAAVLREEGLDIELTQRSEGHRLGF